MQSPNRVQYLSKVQARAFTLIELLVVIAIIAILAAILFPVFAQAKMAAKQTVFMSNLKQTTLGAVMYLSDSEDTFMPRDRDDQKCPNYTEADDATCGEMPGKWSGLLYPYTKSLGTLYSTAETDRNRTWVDPQYNAGYFTHALSPAVKAKWYGWSYDWGWGMPIGYNGGAGGYDDQEGVNRRSQTSVARPSEVILMAGSQGGYSTPTSPAAWASVGLVVHWLTDSGSWSYSPVSAVFKGGTPVSFVDGHAKYLKQSYVHSNAQQPNATNATSIWSIK